MSVDRLATTESIRVFAPATVSNVACGFDVFGFALAGLGDEVRLRHSGPPGVRITAIHGDSGRLPVDPEANTASVAAQAILDHVGGPEVGIEIEIEKRMPLASGLGSSAASAVAGALAAAHLVLGADAPRAAILKAALAGELIASGTAHADNLAPSLYGGFVLVRTLEPAPEVIELPVPEDLYCALLHPHLELETSIGRRRLSTSVPLPTAIQHWANTAALVTALFRRDYELLSRALFDGFAEPVRAGYVPGFDAIRRAALETGALGSSLSGSGPSLFALCVGETTAQSVSEAMQETLVREAGLEGDRFVSRVGVAGARVVACPSQETP